MRRGVVVWMGCMVLAGLATSAWAEHELSEEELRLEMARNKTLSAYVTRNGMPDLAESRFLDDVGPWDDHEVTVYYLDRRKELGFARAFLLGRPEVQIQRYERVITDEEASALAERSRHWKGQIASAEHEREMRAQAEAGGKPAPDERDATAQAEAGGKPGPDERDATARAEADRQLGPDERAENAARRAEAAAGRVESAALTTEQAADRTEAVVAKMESSQAARPRRKKKVAAQPEKVAAQPENAAAQPEKAPAQPDVVSQK